jgi:LruC domain-containing protein
MKIDNRIKKSKIYKTKAILAFVILIVIGTKQSSAQTIYVNDNSTTGDIYTSATGNDASGTGTTSSPYATISKAITVASAGTTIKVDAGTYSNALTINKSLTLQGTNLGTLGNGTRVTESIIKDVVVTISGTAAVILDGFHIYQTTTATGATVAVGNTPTTIQNCKIERVGGTGGVNAYGIQTTASSTAAITIQRNLFTGSSAGGLFGMHKTWNSGVYSNGGSNITITNNTLQNCRTSINSDNHSSGVTISNNTFSNNGTQIAFGGSTANSGSYTLSGNTFSVTSGYYIINLSNVTTSFRLDLTNNTFGSTAAANLSISQCFDVENTMGHKGVASKNGLITIQAGKLFKTASTTFANNILYATAGNSIYVSSGTYAESLNINKALTILGPNANISPNGGSRATEAIIDLSTGTKSIYINASNITIKGFEIINSANAGAIMGGSGISGISNSTPTNIVIENNYMHDLNGAAILLLGNYTVRNCAWTINDNKIDRTTLGTYLGGGYGSGIKMWTGSNCTITNNVLTNIGFTGIDVGWIQNSTISGNTLTTLVDNGMQVVGTNSNLSITNNTITNANYPSATLGQGGIKLFGSPTNLIVTNNIVTGCGSAFAVEPNNNAAGASVNNNNFSGNTYGVYHAGNGTLNATCNWYGSASHSTIAPKISGTVTFVSFLVSGTDNDLATKGFQPALGTCTGEAVSAPTIGSSAGIFSVIGQSNLTFSFTKGNGSKRVIFVKAGAAISSNPENDNSYTASSTFGNGTQLDNGYCVFNDTGNTVSVTGLNASTTYHFTVIEYNYLSSTIYYAGSLAYSSNATTLQPDTDNDGVADADDQYPNDQYKAFNNNFPAAGFGTLMYEDLWPGKGDYDFNDLVVDYRLNTITNADNNIVEMSFTFVTRAIGGSLHNGFAFQLDGINPSKITSVTGSKASGAQWISLNANGTEAGQTNNANILVFDDAYKLLPTQAGFSFVNVYEGSPNSGTDTTTIVVKFLSNGAAPSGGTLSYSAFNTGLFNPYLIVGQDRGKEIHLADKVYTDKMNLTYLGKDQDRTNPSTGKYFKTADNLPWAINVDASIPFTKEKTDISEAYLKFIDWASSGGNSSVNWFLNLDGNRNTIKLMNR